MASNENETMMLIDVNLIDLTETFGIGNEPNLNACRSIFTKDYYEYYNPNE